MLAKKLYLQIYATILLSMVAVIFASAVMWELIAKDAFEKNFSEAQIEITQKLDELASADESQEAQKKSLENIGRELEVNLTLYDDRRNLIAFVGEKLPPPRRIRYRHYFGWSYATKGNQARRLPDGRIIVAEIRHGVFAKLKIPLYLGVVCLVVFGAAYPLVRRLTRRLEKLNDAMTKFGDGELDVQVDVSGRDEIAKLTKNFNETTQRIKRLVNANKMLLANASHELRTPLARIRLGIEMIEKKSSPKRQKELKEDINELDGLIDEILLMSRLDNQQTKISETINLNALVKEEVLRFEGIRFEGENVEMVADAMLTKRVVRNLLDNAVKHGKKPVKVSVGVEDGNAMLVVEDGGKPISKDMQPKLFDPFFRGPTTQNTNGYGLGLAIVKQIAEVHGGNVRLDEDEQVNRFIVTMPIR